jgi:hypothetical protein
MAKMRGVLRLLSCVPLIVQRSFGTVWLQNISYANAREWVPPCVLIIVQRTFCTVWLQSEFYANAREWVPIFPLTYHLLQCTLT